MKRATVAIVGRPNVGKSTLFNRMVGRREAIVSERPGVTRDRHFSAASWRGKEFWLVDTGGWIPGKGDAIAEAIRRHVERAIAESDLVLFVVDCQEGLQPVDEEIAQILRPHRERVILVANKADELPETTSHHAFHALGLGEPIPVSAASGKGSGDLLDLITSRLPETRAPQDSAAIQVAVVGRPNVGKSSIVNRLLGEERSIVTPEPGTTRDPVDSLLRYQGRTLNFIDTAGLRRRSKVIDEIEFYSALRTERAIERADVCVLVVDATLGFQSQDVRIARRALEQGCGLIVAVNKWDLVGDKDAGTAARGEKSVKERVPELQAIPFVYVSALTGLRVRKILDLVLSVAEERGRRVTTAEVNRLLRDLVERNQPPQKAGREVKLLYASQIGVAPPTFAVVANRPDDIPESYRRYLLRGFREAWGFEGVPIRIRFKKKRSKSAKQD
ncbi:MAG: GTPase Der [Gemmatimonadales bacterium]|nr:GTPase Der [bacterium HR33]GIW51087.1 MAG: GTPase Der [Gemmatimonadales bacterium]